MAIHVTDELKRAQALHKLEEQERADQERKEREGQGRGQQRDGETVRNADSSRPAAAPPPSSSIEPPSKPNEANASRELPTEPQGAQYEPDLVSICRVAAQIGAERKSPINYESLLIAFHYPHTADSFVLRWFPSWTGDIGDDIAAMFRATGADEGRLAEYVEKAERGELPQREQLYSTSARWLLREAVKIAKLVATSPVPTNVIGARHLMAALALRSPAEHMEQVRGWRLDPDEWADTFLSQAERMTEGIDGSASEDWGRLKNDFARTPTQLIGTFTSDDPLAPGRDLLGIDDEAAAFARIVVAESVKPPLAIGIFGEWGSGKTFFMRRIYDNVAALSADAERRKRETGDAGPFLPDVVQIRFNAWHYIETNLWASLVEYIFAELDRWLERRQADASSMADAELVFNRLATARQLKLDALDEVVTRRAERRSAELRADRARRAYEEARVRASGVGAGTYARALLETVLEKDDLKEQAKRIGEVIGAPHLQDSTGRVIEVLEQARSEGGRAQLTWRATTARLGTVGGVLAVLVVLFVVPQFVVGLRDFLYGVLRLPWLKQVNEVVLAVSGLLTGIAAAGGLFLRQARAAIGKIDAFDKAVGEQVQAQVKAASSGPAADQKKALDDDLAKRKQALEAAERALAEAESKLNAARSDFEAATARSRLNAFIRAKAADSDYAKHLGIIAAIRRDFGQLASLIGAAKDVDEGELERLENQGQAAVVSFLDRMTQERGAKLTASELQSLLMLVEPGGAVELLEKRKGQLEAILDDPTKFGEILALCVKLKDTKTPTLSRIVLYIDDLDRCSPEVVVKVLEAVHLLLCFPLFTVVVAVDARWVSRALHERFPKLLERGAFATGDWNDRESEGATSLDYLEKIFQLPYWVRAVDSAGARRYVSTLVSEDVRRSETTKRRGTDHAGTDGPLEGSAVPGNVVPIPPGPVTSPSAPSPANVPSRTPESRRSTQASAEPLTAASVGLEINQQEATALERFAPLISPTPRRLLRFVNLYRLLKTALRKDVRENMFGKGGWEERGGFCALIAQLAIVTGAPDGAPAYFAHLHNLDSSATVETLIQALSSDAAVKSSDSEIVVSILKSAVGWEKVSLTVQDLKDTSELARRYSFTAWNM